MALHDPNRKYNFAEEGLPIGNSRFAFLSRAITPGKVQAAAPEMKGDGTTVVFLPYPDFDDPDLIAGKKTRPTRVLPDRQSDAANDFGRWLFYSPDKGVLRFGKVPVTLFFDNPADAGYNADEEHPIHLIYWSVYRAVSKGLRIETPVGSSESDDWPLLLNGNKAKKIYEVLKRPDNLYASYALICKTGDKPDGNYIESGPPLGGGADDLPVAFIMAKSVVRELTSVLNTPLRNDDPTAGLLHSSVTGNKFIHFFDKKVGSCQAMRGVSAAHRPVGGLGGQRRSAPAAGAAGEDQAGFGYGVFISDTHNGMPQGIRYKREDLSVYACATLPPWRDSIRGHTPEECAAVVESVCGLPPSVLAHAWKTRPEFMSETLKGLLVSRTISLPPRNTVPGAVAGVFPTPVQTVNPAVHATATDVPADAAPWGGRISDPPVAAPVAGVTNPDQAQEVRGRFQDLLRKEAAAAGVRPAGPAIPAPQFDPNSDVKPQ